MTCSEFREGLQSITVGTTPSTFGAFLRHRNECTPCKAWVNQMAAEQARQNPEEALRAVQEGQQLRDAYAATCEYDPELPRDSDEAEQR